MREILAAILVVGAGVVFMMLGGSPDKAKNAPALTSTPAAEVPRNNAPMGELTSLFEQMQAPINNRLYTYYWFQPERPWPEGIKFPLILLLHGAPGNVYEAPYLATRPLSNRYPAFLLAPVLAKGRYWALPSENPDLSAEYALGDMVELVKQMAAVYPVDMNRIYVAGCSDGGTGVYGAARYFPDIFAAGVAFSGSWEPSDGVNMTRMPLLAVHGAADTVIPAEQARMLVEIIRSRGGPAWYKEFPLMSHQCSSKELYTSDAWEWLFSQKRRPAPAAPLPPSETGEAHPVNREEIN